MKNVKKTSKMLMANPELNTTNFEMNDKRLVLGYDFSTYKGLLSFKRWDWDEKCKNKFNCFIEKDKVSLGKTDATCGEFEVKHVIPKQNVQIACWSIGGKLSDTEMEENWDTINKLLKP